MVVAVASGPPVDDEVASGSPVASVAASLKFPVDDAVPSNAPLDSVTASLKDDAVPLVVSATVDSDAVPPDAPAVRGKHFYFPPVLEDAPKFSVHAKGSFGSKSILRREAIQLYRISRRELEKRLSIACSSFFVDKGGDPRSEVREVG